MLVPYVGRLTDDTFTIDEVNEMLDSLLSVVRGEVDNELNHTAHTNILLLVQLFQQAEKWHLKLQADISELENRFVHGFFFLVVACVRSQDEKNFCLDW